MGKGRKNIIIIGIMLTAFLIVTFSFTFAVVVVYEGFTGEENSSVVLGDIYMHYDEGNSQIMLENAVPSTTYNPNSYFEFIVSGKNTYTKNDIYYEIVLSHGETHPTRTERIRDDLLRFTLVEVNSDNTETILVDGENYNINDTRIYVATVPKNTSNEINKRYRLYMWIDYNTMIGNTSDSDYDQDTWNNDVFASIKVNVTGDVHGKMVVKSTSDFKQYVTLHETKTTVTDIDGTIYMSGNNDEVNYNYVWYSGKLWRITAINPDGTLKLITDDLMTPINWGPNNVYESSYVKQWLNQEFLPTLYNHENIIKKDSTWYVTSDNFDVETGIPQYPKNGTFITAEIGLLTAYEYYMSYKNSLSNYLYETTSYLDINSSWFLMTPDNSSNLYIINYYGNFRIIDTINYGGYAIRPSINLNSNIQFFGGIGTKNNPYVIKDDIGDIKNNEKQLNRRQSGEYVKIENDIDSSRVFRIIDSESINGTLTTKLILNDYVREAGVKLKKYFSSSNRWWDDVSNTNTTYWRGYLNTTWLSTLNVEMLEKGIYYLGASSQTESYKTTVCRSAVAAQGTKDCIINAYIVSDGYISRNDYVGLLRKGEVFVSNSSLVNNIWLLTTPAPNEYYAMIYEISNGLLSSGVVNWFDNSARPTINLKSTVVIKSGSGTEQDPFIVGLPDVDV